MTEIMHFSTQFFFKLKDKRQPPWKGTSIEYNVNQLNMPSDIFGAAGNKLQLFEYK